MKVIVRYTVPSVVARITDEVRDFTTHLDACCYEDYFEQGGVPPSNTRVWRLALRLAVARYWMPVLCLVMGCELIDDDPGDPEVGPRPRVYCARCGR